VDATLAALREAGSLASALGGRIHLVVPQIVAYPLPLTSPPILVDFTERRLRVIAEDCKVETRVSIYLCRDAAETLKSVLKPGSVVVIGSRKSRWPWPTPEKRLAAQLRRAGHEVVVTERN
jgi:lipoprotein-anchoring transpeptidase ErfK/SrfK